MKSVVHGIAHITGGGLREQPGADPARRLPGGACDARVGPSRRVPWLRRLGEVEPAEMDRVFNMGLGLVLVVSPFYAESIRSQLDVTAWRALLIGQIVEGPPAWPGTTPSMLH